MPQIAKRGVLGRLGVVLGHSSAIESGREGINNIFIIFSHTKTLISRKLTYLRLSNLSGRF
jgi:hypothetical protein